MGVETKITFKEFKPFNTFKQFKASGKCLKN
jgi:hypothetical protein